MNDSSDVRLADTGERMIPTEEGEVSVVFARHQFAYIVAQQFVSGKDVLDLGCGTGYGCRVLAGVANRVLGIDQDADAIAYCKAKYSSNNITFEQADVRRLDTDGEFDVAVSFQVIEHLQDPDDFVRRIKRAVRKGGKIVITTPNVRTPQPSGEGNPFHFSEMSYADFSALLGRHFDGFRVLGIGYSSRNWLRSIIQALPFYQRLGLLLRRGSRIKRIASSAMSATTYDVIEDDVATKAIDLLAVCNNNREDAA